MDNKKRALLALEAELESGMKRGVMHIARYFVLDRLRFTYGRYLNHGKFPELMLKPTEYKKFLEYLSQKELEELKIEYLANGYNAIPIEEEIKNYNLRKKVYQSVRNIIILKEDGKHFQWPGLIKIENELLVVCRQGIEHVDPYGKILLLRSEDKGKTWNFKTIISQSDMDDRDPSILRLKDNIIGITVNSTFGWYTGDKINRMFVKECNAITENGKNLCLAEAGPYFWISNADGEECCKISRTKVFSPHGAIVHNDKIYYCGLENNGSNSMVNIYSSNDNGKTWNLYSNVVESKRPVDDTDWEKMDWPWYNEPHMCILPDGMWIIMFRVDFNGYLYETISSDNGKTWTTPWKTSMWGTPPHLLLLSDERLLCSYGYRRPPYGIRACLSYDKGKTWDIDNEIIIRDDGGHMDLGYPVAIEYERGKILMVYYFNDSRDGDCFLAGSFFEI